jgi:predicted O-linked N-acetylglucosamine transferase (SPINDLY family)
MGTSFMQAAGLPDWVAHTEDEFVAIAQTKSKDRTALLALKQGLRAHIQAQPAWNVQRHTREFEALLFEAARGH